MLEIIFKVILTPISFSNRCLKIQLRFLQMEPVKAIPD